VAVGRLDTAPRGNTADADAAVLAAAATMLADADAGVPLDADERAEIESHLSESRSVALAPVDHDRLVATMRRSLAGSEEPVSPSP
jgi:hypothetical protein